MVKMYYKHDNVRSVMDALQRRFNIKLLETDKRVISQVVLEFEASGSVLRGFGYQKAILDIPDHTPPSNALRTGGIKEEEIKQEEVEITIAVDEMIIEESEEEGEVVPEEYIVLEEGCVQELEEIATEERNLSLSEAQQLPKQRNPEESDTIHPCSVCQMEFKNIKYLQRHMKYQHDPNKASFICEICGKELSSQKTHKVHMLIHSEEKKHVCPECGARFARRQGLKRHFRTHSGEKPYVCKHCDTRFASFMSHQMHVRLHTGERPHKCRHCGEAFIGAPALNVGDY